MISFPQQALPLRDQASILSADGVRAMKLRKATREFEAIFLSQLLKAMRRNPISDDREDAFGKKVMLEIGDEAVARHLAQVGALGIGDMLYARLAERLSAGDGETGASPVVRAGWRRSTSRATSQVAGIGQFQADIRRASQETGLSPRLIQAVIKQESAGDPLAMSSKGAAGLMQLMPDTAREMGVTNRFDPSQNIMGGAKYLRRLIDQFRDLRLALAAYNAGPSRVQRYGDVPPYSETQDYVSRIIADLREAK
jgi:soluble lytic murein transglycosylase-like protein